MFELLSYLLFCQEHGSNVGIFRYLNQTAIETNPIAVDSKKIGFQAKYWSGSISEHKEEIKNSITRAKNKYSGLDIIYYYLHKEFGQSTILGESKPKYQREIEEHANKLGIAIEWRVSSHFERQLMEEGNRYWLEFFFSQNPSTVSHINDFHNHGITLLKPIQTAIKTGATSTSILIVRIH